MTTTNEWIRTLEAELESSCNAEHLRQEREARKRVEAKVQELDSLLTYSLQHSEKFREWAEAEVEELQSEIKMLTKKLSSTEDELADACEWLNERYKATSEADERAEKAEAELAEEIKENCDQARLLAMSASRESAALGKTQRLEAQNEKLRGLLELVSRQQLWTVPTPYRTQSWISNRGELGQYLWDLRHAAGIKSIREAEEVSGVSNAYISQIDTGKIKKPSPDILIKLSEAYKAPYETLMEMAGHIKRNGGIGPDGNRCKICNSSAPEEQ